MKRSGVKTLPLQRPSSFHAAEQTPDFPCMPSLSVTISQGFFYCWLSFQTMVQVGGSAHVIARVQ